MNLTEQLVEDKESDVRNYIDTNDNKVVPYVDDNDTNMACIDEKSPYIGDNLGKKDTEFGYCNEFFEL